MQPSSKTVNAIVRSTSMPIIAAASRSCAVARIALPRRVRWTRKVSPARTGTVITRTISLFHVKSTPLPI